MQNDDFGFKKKGMTVKVINGNIESAMLQLKRRMNSEGINKELRKRKNFTPNSVLKRQAMAEAKLRWKKKYSQIMDIELPKKKIKKKDKIVNSIQLWIFQKSTINLLHNVPEELKPRKIAIGSDTPALTTEVSGNTK